ncbi:MAG: hypothetical protein IPK82_03750 [Polyangiaceae bacterium]|nr:hypothetical protein [Polyangiaceae bacterium]
MPGKTTSSATPAKKKTAIEKPAAKKSVAKKPATPSVASEVAQIASAAVRRAEELIALIERRKATITESFYEIGKALKELQQKKLYASLGYKSFDAMLRARGVFGVTQAGKLIQIVSTVPVKTALQLGPEKAFALVRYAAATPELDTPETLVTSGAKIGKTSASAASVREITEATKQVRAKAKNKKVDPQEVEAERTAGQGRTWLKAHGVKGGEVLSRRTKQGFRVFIELPVAAAGLLFAKKV